MPRELRSIATRSDSYKYTHAAQYPPGTNRVYSYLESRDIDAEICFFGLQHILKTHLVGRVITQEKLDYAEQRVNKHLGPGRFRRDLWQDIVDNHGGRLPVVIKAVPEGSIIPGLNVLATVENTDPKHYWLTNFLETVLMQTWYPTTVATLSRNFKKMLAGWAKKTGAPKTWINFGLHDFGFRGVSSVESAGIGGMAHLVNFMGTDTFEALEDALDSYGEDMAGFSIPAAEHSTITSWGEDQEMAAYQNMLRQFPSGLVAVVSDSYDILSACRDLWGGLLRDQVLTRDGVVVIRPDSGKPWEVVRDCLNILWEQFRNESIVPTRNNRGYKVLHPKIRIIQGDGVDMESADRVCQWATDAGFGVENLSFGMGGALLQKLHRDTFNFAFKCSWVQVNGQGRDVYKRPKTMASKNSKRGRFSLVQDARGEYHTIPEGTGEAIGRECLRTVFQNGELLVDDTFASIRNRAAV